VSMLTIARRGRGRYCLQAPRLQASVRCAAQLSAERASEGGSPRFSSASHATHHAT
jgi:hypothetical protein